MLLARTTFPSPCPQASLGSNADETPAWQKPYGVEFNGYRYNSDTGTFDHLPSFELSACK